MIVTDQFVFVHLHKSGGSFVNKVIMELFPNNQTISYHYPMRLIPDEYRHLPVLGTVRNPWSFYVSYYLMQTTWFPMTEKERQELIAQGFEPPMIDIMFEILSNEKRYGFEDTITNMLNLGIQNNSQLNKLLDAMPTKRNTSRKNSPPVTPERFLGKNIIQKDLEKIRGTAEGEYTFLFKHMYHNCNKVHFLKMENLREDLVNFYEQQHIKFDKEYILKTSPENEGTDGSYRKYYTPKLKKLVQERDAFIIKRFKYEF